MYKVIEDINVHYVDYGVKEKPTIVLLHGWGQNIEMMRPIVCGYENRYRIVILDLPGFGESEEPFEGWTVYDYAVFLNCFLKSLEIENPILVGHSFGGKIALVYASKYITSKMVLFACPFCKKYQKLPLKSRVYKVMKRIPGIRLFAPYLKTRIGSTDYRNASDIMRGILVSTVNTEIYEDLPFVSCPTLLIWGTKDEAVPIEKARELEQQLPNAGLVVYENATHYAYLEHLSEVRIVMDYFLNEEEVEK